MIVFHPIAEKSAFTNEAGLKVSPEQERFAGADLGEYVRSWRDDEDQRCFFIVHEFTPIGFFALDFQEDRHRAYTRSDSQFCVLRNYFIDVRFQGKGYAKQSLKRLPDFVREHFPHVKKIYLTVNERNSSAQNLYLQGGFARLPIQYLGGDAGPQAVMALDL